jgi:hypothetical protein
MMFHRFFRKTSGRHLAGSVVVAVVLALLTLYVGLRFYSTSPLNIWENTAVYRTGYIPQKNGDSVVFLSVGKVILDGGMPYRDVFDHKGPLLYLVEAFGLWLGGLYGVWFFELLALGGSLFFLYRTARLFTGRATACLAVCVAALGTVDLLRGGNFTETYALPFQAATLCVFTRFLKQDFTLSRMSAFRVGAEFGAVFLLRPNITGIWILFCVVLLITSLVHRNYAFLFSRTGFFLAGAATLAVPILVWLGIGGAMTDFVWQFWIYNVDYSSLATWERFFSTLRYFAGLSYFIPLAAAIYVFLAMRPSAAFPRGMTFLFATNFLLGLCLAAMPGRQDTHYLISLVVGWFPALVWVTERLTESLTRIGQRKRAVLFAAFYAFLLLFPIWPVLEKMEYHDFQLYRLRLREAASPLVDPQTDEIIRWVCDRLDPTDTLAGYGENSIARILFYSGRPSASKYIYCPSLAPPIEENPFFRDLLDTLKKSEPDCFIREKRFLSEFDVTYGTRSFFPGELRDWLGARDYHKVYENEGFEIYVRGKRPGGIGSFGACPDSGPERENPR